MSSPPLNRAPRRRVSAATAALTLLAAGLSTAVAVPASAAVVQCSVDYTTNDWGSGFTANVAINNKGAAAINGWTLTYSYAGNQTLSGSGWNGTWSQSGKNVTVVAPAWASTIAAGGSATAGANFSYSGSNAAPTGFAVNGTSCTGAHAAPTTALTSPAPGANYQAGAAIPLSATASAADGASISKVEFYDNTTLIGTATAAPYAFSWTGAASGSHSVYAKAYDSLGASSESTPAGITVAAGPAISATPLTLSVNQGKTGGFALKLTSQPSANVTVTTTRTAGNTGLSVSSGGTLTFTPSNWSTPQTVTLTADAASTGSATFTSSATGYTSSAVTVTELAVASGVYNDRFLQLYNKIKDPANGYFSPEGIPYHSVETLLVEAPDQGHETTSEAYSYLIWLEAQYGRVTKDWSKFNAAWTLMETYMIPGHADQPTNSFYNASKPATYAPERPLPSDYPAALDTSITAGSDPIAGELKSAYGTDDIYGMHWLQDVDNVYGYGNAPGKCEAGPADTGPSFINTYQRGAQESVFETIPQPTCDNFKYGGKNGYLDLFVKDNSYAKQWKYTDAPDADARAIQAAYWADTWAKAQGNGTQVAGTVAKAGKMGDYLRYAFFDKYFKQIGNCVGASACAAGSGKSSEHYLLSWYYAWGGATDTSAGWSWRIGDSAAHGGYQNPMAAYALVNDPAMAPKSTTGKSDWSTSMGRQVEFTQWLQSNEGAIAGGATNSWEGNYGTPPAGTPTFYGMFYDEAPVYHDPPSNQWFGFQAWGLERMAEYYYSSGDAKAKAILDKWVTWALSQTTFTADGGYQIPSTLAWSGKPDTWNAASPGANTGLHVSVVDYTKDVGVAGSYAKLLAYYAAKSGNAAARTAAQKLLDGMWANSQDALGISIPETRADYSRFNDSVSVPSGWTGTMPNGDPINGSSTFLSIRSWYRNDPSFAKVQAYLNGGAAPTFTYHRFWAQADIATAMATYGELFGG
ncbi:MULTISPECIES: glycoside hydrolase family 48 protein [Kitasatospora]|uniref:Putative glycoside hydrolase n=1 Tax=Kitasatospora setae (strain ATCC 33774 / DSM 43861 / JCM 3304 / KCC A-0304 / NBRC 14216 / KM-6054) TaxID=452652 RepID=E4N0B5_KITSK|nr:MULTISPECIES: glycoside hydrolase family 48 protein [Kitasatospora]BAJ31443.1 putative glycoside hydrolase [Kitasatospora setae KM-6054]